MTKSTTIKAKATLILSLSIVLCFSSQAKAGCIGEEAAAMTAAMTPVLERIVNGTRDIKDALKFNELLAQYDEIKKIEGMSNEELRNIKVENQKLTEI